MAEKSTGTLAYRELPLFGVEIDLDLSAPLSEDEGAELIHLLWEHSLLLLRGQTLSAARQREICALAGPILFREGESGYLTTETPVEASRSELSFHADAAYTNAPFDALALHAVDVVDDASATLFISAEKSLARLPVALRQRLEGQMVEMISPAYDALAGRSCDQRDPIAQKRGELPAIKRNPHNGRDCIWVSEMQAARIVGLDWAESRDLLHAVYDHLYESERVHTHRWRNGDFVIWDNIALQHARGHLNDCGKRVLQRSIVGREGVCPHIAVAS